eukprot:2019469-Pleurochrysis_carterae.AAC.1
MPIAGSCIPSNPSSAFERPMLNATMGVAMASRSRSVVEMIRVARVGPVDVVAGTTAGRMSFKLRCGDTRGPGGLLPVWLALKMVSGVALALASAS